jgi:hypothetical protein
VDVPVLTEVVLEQQVNRRRTGNIWCANVALDEGCPGCTDGVLPMFGMLDYRASKLFTLIASPFYFLIWIISCFVLPVVVCVVTILKIEQFVSNPLLQLLVCYSAVEIVTFVWLFVGRLIWKITTSIFYLLVDPIPTNGRTQQEANARLLLLIVVSIRFATIKVSP